jgi:tripartite-type tricarboxylate transporter receptor subunit TctC
MKLPRRRLLRLAAGAAVLPVTSPFASAQAYPTRPVRILVGFAAAGGNDIVARIIGQRLSEKLGQPFIIENRPGAGTNLATEAALRARPDGYTLLLASPASAINATLYENLSFNFIRDSAPVAGITSVPDLMVVHPSVPARTVAESLRA